MTAAPDPWDAQAEHFDDEPDHGLRDPGVREAWRALLLRHLPSPGASVADVGCGTGSLSCLLAGEGFAVTGVDRSPRMLDVARAKTAAGGLAARFLQGDAVAPPVADASVDVVLVRHVLWALPDADTAVRSWVRLLRPGGRLVLVEGRWHTGGGLAADDVRDLLLRHRTHVEVARLDDPALWGRAVDDERYLVVSLR